MRNFHALRSAFRSAPHLFTVLALAAAIMVPTMVSATGDTGAQSVFGTGSPCAAFDTRFWDTDGDGATEAKPAGKTGGTPNELKFYVTGNGEETGREFDFWNDVEGTPEAHQGGSQAGTFATANSDGCGVPATAETVLLNLEAIEPAGDGNLQVYPPAGTPGGVLIYDSSDFGASNMLVVEIATGDQTQGELLVGVNGPSVHVRGSVVGYTCPVAGC